MCFFLFQITKVCGQGYKEIYFSGVKDVEVLVLDFWLEKGGRISDVKRVADKSTYDNTENVANLIKALEEKPFNDYEGEKIRVQFIIKLINPKYENYNLTEEECKKVNFLRDGQFIYTDPMYSGVVVERHGQNQIEKKSEKILVKGQIEWLSDCSYNLLYPEGEKSGFKKADIVHVEIIGLLDSSTVVYRSIINGQIITGIMKKL